MKRLIILLFVLLLPLPAWAVPAVDQVVAKINFDNIIGAQDFSFGTLPAAGSVVCATFWAWANDDFDISTVTDNQANTYVVTKTAVVAKSRAVIACAPNVNSSGTFTITLTPTNAGGVYSVVSAASFTEIQTSSPIDQTASAIDAGPQANDATVTSGATTVDDEVVIAVAIIASVGDAALTITTPAGYTAIAVEQDNNAHLGGQASYLIVAATGAQTATWSHDDVGSTADDGWGAVIVTLKGIVAAGATRRYGTPIFFP